MKTMRYRKAQMNLANFGGIAIALVVAVVILGVMAAILATIQGTQPNDSTTRANNETFSFINGTAQGFGEGTVETGSVVVYVNDSKINKGRNYTTTSDAIIFLNETEQADSIYEDLEADALNVTYGYTIGSTARNITQTGLAANLSFASFLPVIAIVAVSAIVIGMVLVMFGRRKEE